VPWTTFRKNYEFTYCDGGECRVGVLPFIETKLASVEHEMIVEALKTHRGSITNAPRELKLTRRVLGLRMAKHGIDYQTFRRKDA
jgi:DNA-binding NtrC family response regulator